MAKGEGLVWIRKDLWESKSFTPEDCHPVGEGDRWVKDPVKLNFAEDYWRKGDKASFVEVVKAMVAHGRGRGLRARAPKED